MQPPHSVSCQWTTNRGDRRYEDARGPERDAAGRWARARSGSTGCRRRIGAPPRALGGRRPDRRGGPAPGPRALAAPAGRGGGHPRRGADRPAEGGHGVIVRTARAGASRGGAGDGADFVAWSAPGAGRRGGRGCLGRGASVRTGPARPVGGRSGGGRSAAPRRRDRRPGGDRRAGAGGDGGGEVVGRAPGGRSGGSWRSCGGGDAGRGDLRAARRDQRRSSSTAVTRTLRDAPDPVGAGPRIVATAVTVVRSRRLGLAIALRLAPVRGRSAPVGRRGGDPTLSASSGRRRIGPTTRPAAAVADRRHRPAAATATEPGAAATAGDQPTAHGPGPARRARHPRCPASRRRRRPPSSIRAASPHRDRRRRPRPTAGSTPAVVPGARRTSPPGSSWQPAARCTLDDLRLCDRVVLGLRRPAAHGRAGRAPRRGATRWPGVFQALFDSRFPIEEMRVTSAADLDAPPTGDGNNTVGLRLPADEGHLTVVASTPTGGRWTSTRSRTRTDER